MRSVPDAVRRLQYSDVFDDQDQFLVSYMGLRRHVSITPVVLSDAPRAA